MYSTDKKWFKRNGLGKRWLFLIYPAMIRWRETELAMQEIVCKKYSDPSSGGTLKSESVSFNPYDIVLFKKRIHILTVWNAIENK
jgi:hypothetical protein